MRCFGALAAIQHVPQDKKNNNNPTMFYIQQNASFWLVIIIKPEREKKWTERPIYSEKKVKKKNKQKFDDHLAKNS